MIADRKKDAYISIIYNTEKRNYITVHRQVNTWFWDMICNIHIIPKSNISEQEQRK